MRNFLSNLMPEPTFIACWIPDYISLLYTTQKHSYENAFFAKPYLRKTNNLPFVFLILFSPKQQKQTKQINEDLNKTTTRPKPWTYKNISYKKIWNSLFSMTATSYLRRALIIRSKILETKNEIPTYSNKEGCSWKRRNIEFAFKWGREQWKWFS